MITRHRASHSVDSSRPKISYPIPVDQLSFDPVQPPKGPSTKPTSPPPPSRAPTTMARNWLSRASTSSSGSNTPYTPSKPVRISEPKLSSAFDALTSPRRGVLGSGATVVRTPSDAMAGSTTSMYETPSIRHSRVRSPEFPEGMEVLPTSPLSPPLPPIPDEAEELEAEGEVATTRTITPPKPTRAPPPVPEEPATSSTPTPLHNVRPAIKSPTPPQSEYSPPVPALPANLSASPPQPAFEPILVSSIPSTPIDPSKLIVSLETSTTTHRTTLKTLLSRPSYLATYLKTILPSGERESDELSVRSQTSEAGSSFHSIFHNHLTSSGLLPQSSTTIHIFLDRPSAPYAHILTYLRTPLPTPENPAILPRPVRLISASSSRLDALLELRDEARYLDLEELYKLCTDEIRTRHGTGNALGLSHTRGLSTSNASVVSSRSLGTLREGDEDEERASQRHSKDSGLGSGSPSSQTSSSPRNSENVDVWHSSPSVLTNAAIPTPTIPGLQQRTLLRGRARSESKKDGYSSVRLRPTGAWI